MIAGKSLYEKKFTVAEGQAALDGGLTNASDARVVEQVGHRRTRPGTAPSVGFQPGAALM